jgi:ribosomal protein S18 acetylase RimI-like enzyme
MSICELREATEADAATVAALIRGAFEEFRGQLDPPSGAHHETEEKVRKKMASVRAVLAFADGAAAGCVLYERGEGHVYLSRLSVLPAYRRRGLARALIGYVEERARALGLRRVRLGVRTALPQQQAYYQRLGYRPAEAHAHPGYKEPTYLMMEKELPDG